MRSVGRTAASCGVLGLFFVLVACNGDNGGTKDAGVDRGAADRGIDQGGADQGAVDQGLSDRGVDAEACPLQLFPETIDKDTTITKGCYLVQGVAIVDTAVTLTLAPGVQLVFAEAARMVVRDKATLSAVGTAEEPILLTGQKRQRGSWGGLAIDNNDQPGNKLEHVTVEYGGGHKWAQGEAAAVAVLSSGFPVQVALSHTTLRESAGYGLFVATKAVLPAFAGNALTKNALGAAYVHSESLANLTDASSYAGNDVDVVVVEGDTVPAAVTWPALDVPYLMRGKTIVDAALTIAAGARLRFALDTSLEVQSTGSLTAEGTAAKPIVFSGEQEQPGHWWGIAFHNCNNPKNKLDHVTVAHGGGRVWAFGDKANIALLSSGFPVGAQVTNSKIDHSAGAGIWLDVVAQVNADIETANTFTGNAGGAVVREQP